MTDDRFASRADAADSDDQPDERPRLPYGTWPSPIRIDDVLGDTVRLSEPWIDGDETYWIEGRPAEGGRSVLVRRGVGRDRPRT